jgi:hypothetical protein
MFTIIIKYCLNKANKKLTHLLIFTLNHINCLYLQLPNFNVVLKMIKNCSNHLQPFLYLINFLLLFSLYQINSIHLLCFLKVYRLTDSNCYFRIKQVLEKLINSIATIISQNCLCIFFKEKKF